MTFDEYLEEYKARNPEFAAGHDSGYALYEQLTLTYLHTLGNLRLS